MIKIELTDENLFLARFLLIQAGINANNNIKKSEQDDQYSITSFSFDVDKIEIINNDKLWVLKAQKLEKINELLVENFKLRTSGSHILRKEYEDYRDYLPYEEDDRRE